MGAESDFLLEVDFFYCVSIGRRKIDPAGLQSNILGVRGQFTCPIFFVESDFFISLQKLIETENRTPQKKSAC